MTLCTCGGKPGEFCGRGSTVMSDRGLCIHCESASANGFPKRPGRGCMLCQPDATEEAELDSPPFTAPRPERFQAHEARIADLEARLAASEAERERLAAHCEALKSANVDLDNLRREARRRLAESEECVASLMRRLSDERDDRWWRTYDAALMPVELAGLTADNVAARVTTAHEAAAAQADFAHGPLTPEAPKAM